MTNFEESIMPTETQLPAVQEAYERDLAQRPTWRVEANFMVLPIFCFDKKGAGKESATLIRSLPDVRDGTVVTRQLVVSTGQREVGGKIVKDSRPGAFDMSVLFCLMDLWDEQGRPNDGVINFRLSTVCNRLKLTDAGKNYEAIKNSILRLSRTKIESKNAFFSKDQAKYLTLSMAILDDAAVAASSAGQAKGGCSVKIGRHILQNLVQNYTAKINRQIYQQLEVAFSQRLLCLILFRQQMLQDVGVVDFELMDLAEMLPMSGKLYPSTIMNRLKTALSELADQKLFKHEFIRVATKHVLRLMPFEQPKEFLVGTVAVDRFAQLIERVYKKPFSELSGISVEALRQQVDRDFRTVEHSDHQYSWSIYVLDVFCHMVANGYEAKDKAKVVSKLLALRDETKLEKRLDFEPVDIVYRKRLQQASLENVATERETRITAAEEESKQVAENYISRLSEADYMKYAEQAYETLPFLRQMDAMGPAVRAEIARLLADDIKAGKEILLRSEQTLTAPTEPYKREGLSDFNSRVEDATAPGVV